MFSFIKNPFERLSAENQEAIKKSLDNISEVLTDKGPIFTKLDSIDKKLETISTLLGDVSKKLDVRGRVKADAKEMKQMGETAKVMGEGMKFFVDAIEAFAKVPDETVDKFVTAVERISEAFKKMEKTAEIITKAGDILIKMGKGVILFGLALLVALPIYLLALPGAIIAGIVIFGFVYLFSRVLGDKENVDKIEKGAESLAMMGVAVILFGIGMLLVGVGVYTKLINVATVIIFGVLLAFVTLFAFALGTVLKDNIREGIETLALMGISVILFGLGIFLASKIYQYLDPLNAAGGLAMIVLTMVAMAGIFFLLSFVKGNLKDGALAMLIMAGSILVLGLSIWAFSKLIAMVDNPWETMAMAGAALLGLALIMLFIGNVKSNVYKGALAMLLSTATIAALGFALFLWEKFEISWDTIAKAGAAILGLGLAIFAAGSFANQIALGSLVMILAVAQLFALGYVLSYWQKQEIEWETLALAGAAVVGLGLAMAGAGLLYIPIGLGAAAMLVAGLALMAITEGFSTFKKSGWTEDDSTILNSALTSMIAGFLGYKSMADIGMGALIRVPMIFGLLTLSSVSLLLAGVALNEISKGLVKFKESNFSSNDGKVLESVIASLISAFSLITDKKRQKEYGIDVDPESLKKGISALTGIGNVMTDLARGIQAFANMKFIEYEVVKDPKTGQSRIQPKDIIELDDTRIEAAGINFGKVVDAILGPISRVGQLEKNSQGWFSSGYIEKGISALTGIGNIMTGMAQGVQSLANLTFTTYEIYTDPKTGEKKIQAKDIVPLTDTEFTNAGENFGKIVDAILGPISSVGKAESSSSGWFSGGYVKKGINALTEVGNIMTSMAEGISKWANLEFVTNEIYRDPKTGQTKIQPSGVEKLSKTHFQKAQLAFRYVVNTVIGSIIDAGKLIEENKDKFKKLIKHQETILKTVTGFQKFTEDWSKIEKPEASADSFVSFTSKIMDLFNSKENDAQSLSHFSIFADKLSLLAKSSKEFESIANSFERIADSMGELKNNLNSLDKDLLAETRGLFDAMAIISKSDGGDKFLKKYSDSLKKTFEELKNLLEEFKGSVDKNVVATQQVAKAVQNPQPVAPGLKPDPRQPQQIVDMTPVITAINNLKTTLTTEGIKVKSTMF